MVYKHVFIGYTIYIWVGRTKNQLIFFFFFQNYEKQIICLYFKKKKQFTISWKSMPFENCTNHFWSVFHPTICGINQLLCNLFSFHSSNKNKTGNWTPQLVWGLHHWFFYRRPLEITELWYIVNRSFADNNILVGAFHIIPL